MKAGCEQRPKPGDDTLISLPFELYDLKSVSAPITSTASSPAPTVTVTSTPTPSSSPSTPSLALKLGLGLGLGLLLLLLLTAAAVVFLRYRKHRKHAESLPSKQMHPQPHEIGNTARQHRTEMQASNPTDLYAEADDGKRRPEADDGKPPVPEKDRWLVNAGASGQGSRSHSFGDLPLYERENRVGRGGLDGAGGR